MKKRTKEELLDELAKKYYNMPYNRLCSRRKRIIDDYAKEKLKSAPK